VWRRVEFGVWELTPARGGDALLHEKRDIEQSPLLANALEAAGSIE
jgi:hypothetical protein